MKLGDIYVNKNTKELIQIDSFASHMGRLWEDTKHSIIVFRCLEKGDVIGSMPSFNGYGTSEEIEAEYELLVPQEKLKEYNDWDEVFALVKM